MFARVCVRARIGVRFSLCVRVWRETNASIKKSAKAQEASITNRLMQFEYFQAALGESNMGFLNNSMCTSTATSPDKEHVLSHNDLM